MIVLMQGPDEQMLAAFGEFVRAQRQLAQVSQRNLAKMSGVSDSYLSQIERGNYRPSPQVSCQSSSQKSTFTVRKKPKLRNYLRRLFSRS